METVELFFNSLILFLSILCCVMIMTGISTTLISYREAKRNKEQVDFRAEPFFFTVIVPAIYLISVAISVVIGIDFVV